MVLKEDNTEQFDFDGLKIRDYTAKLNENSSFAVIEVSPGVSHKLSWSKRSDKYYYLISGEIIFTVNDEEFIFAAGDFCLIKKGEKFKYWNNSNNSAKMILVHTPGFRLDQEVFE